MVLLTKLLLKDGKKMVLFVETTSGWWDTKSLTKISFHDHNQ